MTKDQIRHRIEEIGIIPAIRLGSDEDALFAAEAISASGIPIVEVTMTVPGALHVISKLAQSNSGLLVGAGTVFDIDTAQKCLDAGARFLTSPGLTLGVIEFAKKKNTLVLPGAMTPSEVIGAWLAGADFVKIFPIRQIGGAAYIKALKSPFPNVPLIASGGVNQQNAPSLIHAGAIALGIGRDLIAPDAIQRREDGWIRELSWRYLRIIKEARELTKA